MEINDRKNREEIMDRVLSAGHGTMLVSSRSKILLWKFTIKFSYFLKRTKC